MDVSAYVAALRRDSQALAEAATGDLARRVPPCPEWNVSDLVWHVGEVQDFWRQIAERQLTDPARAHRSERPSDEDLVGWFTAGAGRLADVLESAPSAKEIWTWTSRRDIGFIQRRMAHETAVHRFDAQIAVGDAQPIDARLAVDGVDEFLEIMLPARPERLRGQPESIHLHATDLPGEWLVEVNNGSVTVTKGHAKGTAAVRASASDLLLLLWRRIEPRSVEVFGDGAALDRFLDRADVD